MGSAADWLVSPEVTAACAELRRQRSLEEENARLREALEACYEAAPVSGDRHEPGWMVVYYSDDALERAVAASSATGDSSASSATGYSSASLTTGAYSSSEILPSDEPQHALAVAAGYGSKARAPLGSAIVLLHRDQRTGEIIKLVGGKVDGAIIKPDTWYSLNEAGEMVEAAHG